jgi:superfamily II DNA helicase RecQ
MAVRNLKTEFDYEFQEQEDLKITEEALNFASNALNMTIEEYNNYIYDYCQGNKSRIQKFNESFIRQYQRDKYHNRLDNLSWFVNLRHNRFLEQKASTNAAKEEGTTKSKGVQKSKKSKNSKKNNKKSKKSKKTKKANQKVKKAKNKKNKSKQRIKII